MFLTIIIFFVVLSVIVLVHELGHFYTARKFGAKVEEFGLGLPPRAIGLRKVGDKFQIIRGRQKLEPGSPTVYSLNWVPVGGFVKIKGEGGEAMEESDSFAAKPIWKKSIILSAGVVMNVILCMVLLIFGFGVGMPAVLDDGDQQMIVSERQIQIIQLMPDGRAAAAGLKVGDVITKIDGREFADISELNNYLNASAGQELPVAVNRRGEELVIPVKVEKYVFADEEFTGFGIGLIETAIVRYPWYLAIYKGAVATFIWLGAIAAAFYTIIKNLLLGIPTGAEVAGPVGIAVLTGQAAELGWIYLLQFTALLSLNLAIINILPFPALDGGRLFFLVVEKIRGRAIKQEWENLAHNIGFIILMGLIVLVTFSDIIKYGGGLWGALKGLVGL